MLVILKFVEDLCGSLSNMHAPGQSREANLSWRIWIKLVPKTQKGTADSESSVFFIDICLAYGQHLALVDGGVNPITAFLFTPLMILFSLYFCMFDKISSSIIPRYLPYHAQKRSEWGPHRLLKTIISIAWLNVPRRYNSANKQLNTFSSGWWFGTPWRSHDVNVSVHFSHIQLHTHVLDIVFADEDLVTQALTASPGVLHGELLGKTTFDRSRLHHFWHWQG